MRRRLMMQSNLPYRYVKGLRAYGGAYINTLYRGDIRNINVRVVFGVPENHNGSFWVFGQRNQDSTNRYGLLVREKGYSETKFGCIRFDYAATTYVADIDIHKNEVWKFKQNGLYNEGTWDNPKELVLEYRYPNPTGSVGMMNFPIYIFANNNGGTPQISVDNVGASRFILWHGNEDVREVDMKTCILTSNTDKTWDGQKHYKGELGMWDNARDMFFGNANSVGYFEEIV